MTMAQTQTEPIMRKKKQTKDRWMPGERMQRTTKCVRMVAATAGKMLPGFLLSFADVMGIPSGLHAAWLGALASAGESLLWPGAGCVLALVMRMIWGVPLRLEMLLTLGLMLLSPVVLFRRGAWMLVGGTAVSLLPTALVGFFTGTAADAMMGMACMAVSALSAPIMLRGLRTLRDAKPIDAMEDRVALGYTLGMMICGGGRLLLFGVNLGALAAAWLTLGMGLFLGVAAGTVIGMVGGLLLALQGMPVPISVALAVGGFLAGMVQGLGRRRITSICFALGCGLTMLLSGAYPPGCLAAVIVASGAMILPNRRVTEVLQTAFRRLLPARPSAGDAYAASALASWEKTVAAMAQAVPVPVDDAGQHDGAWWRERLCAGCEDEESCPCMLSSRAAAQAETAWKTRTQDDEAWQAGLENLRGLGCGRLYHLREGMEQLRDADRLQVRQVQKARYQRDMLVTHLTAMAGAARRFAQLSSGESWWDDLSARQLRRRLSEEGHPASLLYARRVQGHAQVAFELRRTLEAEDQAEELCSMTSDVLDTPMTLVRVEGDRVFLAEAPLWAVETGVAACGLRDSQVNGDAFWLGALTDGRYLAALADGMGHGAQAREESTRTVALLRLCLEAGYTRAQALTAVNGMMLLASQGECFSTVDLITIDLWSGQATLDKLGAAPSRLLRGRTMTELAGDALPLGVLEMVESRTSILKLRHDDVLVLLTDGVEDAFGDKAALDDAIREALEDASVQGAADALLRRAREASRTGRQDDMTTVFLRVSRNTGTENDN